METLDIRTEARKKPHPTVGLGSQDGIRWLLLVGALVVTVSVVRLVADEWGQLMPTMQYGLLVLATLWILATGEVVRHRLRLPVAGTALLLLSAVLMPLLHLGAAWTHLQSEAGGWFVLLAGSAVLGLGLRRILDRVFDYRALGYPLFMGVMLLAMPSMGLIEHLGTRERIWAFFGLSAGLGLLLRLTSRHVNRYFFHRDRVSGRDRSLSLFPFALLAGTYVAAVSLAASFSTHLALPLGILGIVLVDTGEEYFQAVLRVSGRAPEPWPRRSLALLTLGFSALLVAVALAPADPERYSLPLVSGLAAWRLGSWALRYRSSWAHVAALVAGILAYHSFPVLVPSVLRQFFQHVVALFVSHPQSPAAVGFHDLFLVAGLLGLAVAWEKRLGPSMLRIQVVAGCVVAAVALILAATEVVALGAVAPVMLFLLLLAWVRLGHWEFFPVVYQAAIFTALAWSSVGQETASLWHPGSALWAGAVGLVFLGVAVVREVRGAEASPALRSAFVMPSCVLAGLLVWTSVDISAGMAGFLLLEAAGLLLLSSRVSGWHFLAAWSMGLLTVALHLLLFVVGGREEQLFGLGAQGLLLTFWWVGRQSAPRHPVESAIWGTAVRWGLRWNAFLGFLWMVLGVSGGEVLAAEAYLLVLGGVMVDRALAWHRPPRNRLRVGLAALALFPAFQLSFLDHPAQVVLVAGASLLGMVGLLRNREVTQGLSQKTRLSLGPALDDLRSFWRWNAVLVSCLYAGSDTLLLSVVLALEVILRALRDPSGYFERQSLVLLLPCLQMMAWGHGPLLASSLMETSAVAWTGLAMVLLALAILQEAYGHRVALAPARRQALRDVAQILAGLSGGLGLWIGAFTGLSPWWALLPAFSASVYFLLRAAQRTQSENVFDEALACGTFFSLAFWVLVFRVDAFGPELYGLGPGLALIGLSQVLRRQMGDEWSFRLFTAGAMGVYSTPLMGLLQEITWGWQIALLLAAVAFGAASFHLRSRSLLVVSSGALVIDLVFFLIKLQQTEPTLLWVAGILFGLALMALAALFEHRQETLRQRFRIWGGELGEWT